MGFEDKRALIDINRPELPSKVKLYGSSDPASDYLGEWDSKDIKETQISENGHKLVELILEEKTGQKRVITAWRVDMNS